MLIGIGIMSGYRVNLDIFSGPMDLLLYLIRKDEVDIYDISLTKITEEYLHYIELLKKLDIDLAGDFLVMASTLMQIKSAMLLPKADPDQIDDDNLLDPRTELIRQLLEYKKFKDAANFLGDVAFVQKMRYPRPNTIVDKLQPETEPEVDLEQVSVWNLLEAFDAIMEATGGVAMDISHISDDTPIDLYQIEILHRLQTEGAMSFEKVFGSKTNRVMLIGLFLALLELIREKLVWVEQAKPLAPIYLKALTVEPAEQAVQKAILAAGAELHEETKQERAEQQITKIIEKDQIVDDQKEPPIAIKEISSTTEITTEIQSKTRLSSSIPVSELPPKSKQTTKDREEIQENKGTEKSLENTQIND